MTELFEPAFLERQQVTYPRLDVRVYAAAVREMTRRRSVRNPNGLLVFWLNRAEKAMRPAIAEREATERAELDRYAALWVTLLRLTATRGLTPTQISRCLETARAEGFPKLNARIDERLAQLGNEWPAEHGPGEHSATDQGLVAQHREG